MPALFYRSHTDETWTVECHIVQTNQWYPNVTNSHTSTICARIEKSCKREQLRGKSTINDELESNDGHTPIEACTRNYIQLKHDICTGAKMTGCEYKRALVAGIKPLFPPNPYREHRANRSDHKKHLENSDAFWVFAMFLFMPYFHQKSGTARLNESGTTTMSLNADRNLTAEVHLLASFAAKYGEFSLLKFSSWIRTASRLSTAKDCFTILIVLEINIPDNLMVQTWSCNLMVQSFELHREPLL